MQLRYLQTLTSIAGDKSSTIVFPVPMDLLSSFMNLPGGRRSVITSYSIHYTKLYESASCRRRS